MKIFISPLGVLFITAGLMSGGLCLFLLLNALFPAIIGMVAVNGVAKGEDGAFGAMVMMFGTSAAVGLTAALAGVFGIAYIADGIGLIARKPWARWLGVALAVPLLFACLPLGAMISILAMVTLLLPDTAKEFAPPESPAVS